MNGKETVAQAIERHGYAAVVRAFEGQQVRPVIEAYLAGGLKVIEITTSCPGWAKYITEYRRRKDLLVGVGTCLTVAQCKEAVAAGAQFVVSPVFDEAVVKEATRLKAPMVPGCSTPSEMNRAHQMGCPFQKLFPEPAGGPMFVRMATGALPFLNIIPTANVDEKNAPGYLDAGCRVIGMGNSFLAPADDLAHGRWGAITARAVSLRRTLEKWHASKAGSKAPAKAAAKKKPAPKAAAKPKKTIGKAKKKPAKK